MGCRARSNYAIVDMIPRKLLIFVVTITAAVADAADLSRRQNAPDCSTIRARQEIRTLSDDQRNRFFAAIRALQAGQRPTAYDK